MNMRRLTGGRGTFAALGRAADSAAMRAGNKALSHGFEDHGNPARRVEYLVQFIHMVLDGFFREFQKPAYLSVADPKRRQSHDAEQVPWNRGGVLLLRAERAVMAHLVGMAFLQAHARSPPTVAGTVRTMGWSRPRRSCTWVAPTTPFAVEG